MPQRVLFGTSSWGLGHATRDLVLIRALIAAGCEVTVVATGPALAVLRGELRDRVMYLDWPDMPAAIATSTTRFLLKASAAVPAILHTWHQEQKRTAKLLGERGFDLIVTDHRYGMVTDALPCYFISHSPRAIAPWRSWFMETAMEWFVARWLRPVRKLLIPDDEQPGLAGEMDHAIRFLPRQKFEYLGILASLERQAAEEDLDIFISISGPEPQRTKLQQIILPQLQRVRGKIAVALGLPGGECPAPPQGVELYPYLNRQQQAKMFARAKLVVCRSGYTSLMELAELGKRALLIPTPGQTEQLYLGKTLAERKLFHSVAQHKLHLPTDVPMAREYPGYAPAHRTAESAKRFVEIVLGAEAESAGQRGERRASDKGT